MRRQGLTRIYRVRGYDAEGTVRWSRMFARRHDAVRWYNRELDWYPKVTLEETEIAGFAEVELRPWEFETFELDWGRR
jgi:hypothetical protein